MILRTVPPVFTGGIFFDYEEMYKQTGNHGIFDTIFDRFSQFYGLPKLTAEVNKIGTLPTEYATIGEVLSAIKGIAEEAKQLAAASIPDPKKSAQPVNMF